MVTKRQNSAWHLYFSPSFADPESLLTTLQRDFPEAVTTQVAERTLYVRIAKTAVSFFGYGYPLVAPLLNPDTGLLPFASREDFAAMKMAAITSRGRRKDFVDLWILISRFWDLSDCLELFSKKFAFRDIGHVVRSLTYFDDADDEPPLRLLSDIDWDTVKTDFVSWVRELLET